MVDRDGGLECISLSHYPPSIKLEFCFVFFFKSIPLVLFSFLRTFFLSPNVFISFSWEKKILLDWHGKVMSDYSSSMCVSDVQSDSIKINHQIRNYRWRDFLNLHLQIYATQNYSILVVFLTFLIYQESSMVVQLPILHSFD